MAEDERHRKHRLWIWGSVVLALLVFLLLAARRPMAPRSVDLLAGPEGSAYHAYATRFARALEKRGFTARVFETRGAIENLTRLARSERPTLALAPSGAEHHLDDPGLAEGFVSLGSLAFEPLWLFVRDGVRVDRLSELAGRTVALGPKGSASRAFAELLLEANGVLEKIVAAPFDELAVGQEADKLVAKEVEAVFLVGSMRSKLVARLLAAEGVSPIPVPRARAYEARFSYLARVEVPRGAADLTKDLPRRDTEILAAATNLVAKEDVHDAVVELLIDVAGDVAPSAAWPQGQFPTEKYASLPLDSNARRFYRDGPSWASKNLPYGLATIVDQLVFVVLPALAVLLTLLKVVPALLGFRFALASFRYTRRMVAIEHRLIAGEDPPALLEALQAIDAESASMHVPPTKMSQYLELRQNIHDGRERIEARQQA